MGALQTTNNQVASVKGLLANIGYKKRFEEILGKKAAGFMASIINISNGPVLAGVEPNSVIASAVVAATLDLPIDPNLGFAYIVPYNVKVNGEYVKKGQFQLGYKGFIQLAMRTGQYKTINAIEVYEGDIKRINRITGDIEFNEDNIKQDTVVGYLAYFKLLNGFEKSFYMTKNQMEKHAKKYSQTYKSNKDYIAKGSKWTTDFDPMAIKTVLKLLLSKYGILSIEMQRAIETDQAVINNEVDEETGVIIQENIEYVDAEHEVRDADVSEQSDAFKNAYGLTKEENEALDMKAAEEENRQ
jgi:recombination protein RecT